MSNMNSFFYTYNTKLYFEHNDCRFNSIYEICEDIEEEFYNDVYNEGWVFMKTVPYYNMFISDCIMFEVLNRLGIYLGAKDTMVLRNYCKCIKVKYNADFINNVKEYMLLNYYNILKFNKEFYEL